MIPVAIAIQVGLGALAGVGVARKMLAPTPHLGQLPPVGVGRAAYVPQVGVGAVNLRSPSLLGAANNLYNYLQSNGCQNAFVSQVQAFQQAWISAGGTLPNDTGGRSPVDGLYGNNTASALRQIFPDAPGGCVPSSAINWNNGAHYAQVAKVLAHRGDIQGAWNNIYQAYKAAGTVPPNNIVFGILQSNPRQGVSALVNDYLGHLYATSRSGAIRH
jgi:hypothetical protein